MNASDQNVDTSSDLFQQDLQAVRLEQARLLFKRTTSSCLIVLAVILYFTALILYAGEVRFALAWLAATSLMVAVVFLFPRVVAPNGVTSDNLQRYLRGHLIISGITGLVWTSFAIGFVDPASTLHLFVSINIVVSISLGGMMPSAEYRPSFVALSSAIFLPFAMFWLITMDGPIRLIGIGVLILYGFGLLVSARSELQTRETLAAKRHRQLTDQLQDQFRATQKATAEKSRFLATTSHDMSQPLQAQGFFIRALRPLLNTTEQNDLLDKVESDWQSQQSLLRSLVETARLESGALTPKPVMFDLGEVLEVLRSEFTDSARRQSLTLAISGGHIPAFSDPLLITRILRNLLSNAIKFTPEHGKVSLAWETTDEAIIVTVTDTGPGISKEDQQRIFDEYVQLDGVKTDLKPGLGLGLTIVRQLADRLSLSLDFQSEPGDGTRVSIHVPHGHPELESEASAIDFASIEGAPLIILIEDDARVRESLSVLLTSWGCRVIAAASTSGAIELLSWSGDLPDLIIADKRLTDDESGIEAALTVREETLAEIPIILLTGDIQEFKDLHTIEKLSLLAKPADADELYRLLQLSLRK